MSKKFHKSVRHHNRINNIKAELPELEKRREELEEAYDKKWNECPGGLDFKQFHEFFEPEVSQLAEISRKMRLVQDYKLEEIPDYGDVMTLEDFIECCKSGGFIDYDGSGNYARDGKMSNITIKASDVRHNTIRTDFDTVVWFNR